MIWLHRLLQSNPLRRRLQATAETVRSIAGAQPDLRLPVLPGDALADLSLAVNALADAVEAARFRAGADLATLGGAAEAAGAVAQVALASHDPAELFRAVAARTRELIPCEGVALATAAAGTSRLTFERFDPEPQWGGLWPGAQMDPDLAARFSTRQEPVVRLAPLGQGQLAVALARDGFQSALLLPLSAAGSPPAVLLLASRQPDAFGAAQVRVVTALASHLAAALHAAALRERLEDTLQRLQATQERLVRAEKLRATGTLASGVAHHFNSVLGAIVGRVQLLRREATRGELAAGFLRDGLAVIETAAMDGAETVRRLRQFSTGDEERVGQVDLGAALTEAVEFTRARWEDPQRQQGPKIHLELDCQPGVAIAGPASQLREAFTNLIHNATDALPHGGTIRLSSRRQGTHAVAVIEDDGLGLDQATRQRAFDPFYSTKGGPGTGLGLSVVYGIVERLGGELKLDSQPGKGTRIELSFPLAGVAAGGDDAAAESAPAQAPPAALTVMIVDDDPMVRDLLSDVAEALGHRAERFASAEEALREFRKGRYQVVLTDLGMSGMSGWELARSIHEIDPGVRIAFVTGWSEDVDFEEARQVGVDRVIAKPFTVEDLESLLTTAATPRASAA